MENRRTSILKRTAAMMEETNANRRVSFHNVRTVQRFDVENFEYQEPQRERFHLSTSDEGSALQEDKTVDLFREIPKRKPEFEQTANSTMNFLNSIPHHNAENRSASGSGSAKSSSSEGMELSSVDDVLSPPKAKADDTMALFENMGHKTVDEVNGCQSFGDLSIPVQDSRLAATEHSEVILREIMNVSGDKRSRQVIFDEEEDTMDALVPKKVVVLESLNGTMDLFVPSVVGKPEDELPSAERTHVIVRPTTRKSVIADESATESLDMPGTTSMAFTPNVMRGPATNASFLDSSVSGDFSEQPADANLTGEVTLLPELTFSSLAPVNTGHEQQVDEESVVLNDVTEVKPMEEDEHTEAESQHADPSICTPSVRMQTIPNTSALTDLDELVDVSVDEPMTSKPSSSAMGPPRAYSSRKFEAPKSLTQSARKSEAPHTSAASLPYFTATPMATPMRSMKAYTPFTPAHRFRQRQAFAFDSPQRDPNPLPRLTLKSQKFMDRMKAMEFDAKVLVPSVKPSYPIPTQVELFGSTEGKEKDILLSEQVILTVLTALRGDRRLLREYILKEYEKNQAETAPMRQMLANLERKETEIIAHYEERKDYRLQFMEQLAKDFHANEEILAEHRRNLATEFFNKCMAARAALQI